MQKLWTLVLLITGVVCCRETALAWPSSPDTNLVVCDNTGWQMTPRVAVTSDGGCYVSWYDWSTANINMMLQYYNAQGVEQWPHNGIIVSDNPQGTSVTDYAIAVDQSNCAILVFNDLRNGGDLDMFAYRIDQSGNFLWGDDGISLGDNAGMDATPNILICSNGDIQICWMEVAPPEAIRIRRFSPSGVDRWNPAVVTISSTYNYEYPSMVNANDGRFIIGYVEKRGSSFSSPRWLYMQKYDSLGVPAWLTPTIVSNAGAISLTTIPMVVADSLGGAFMSWYDTREGVSSHRSWVQRVSSAGVPLWQTNGIKTSLSTTAIQLAPSIARVPGTQDIIAFYQIANSGQTQWGLGGQRITAAGTRSWSENGIDFISLSTSQKNSIVTLPISNGATVVYNSLITSSTSTIQAFRVDMDGTYRWQDSPRIMSAQTNSKSYVRSAINAAGMGVTVWMMTMTDNDIYLQNINGDGSLGNLPTLDAPTNLAIETSGSFYRLTWNAVAGNVSGYRIYAGATSDFVPDIVGHTNAIGLATDTTFTDEAAGGVLERYYRVTAYSAASSSVPGNVVRTPLR